MKTIQVWRLGWNGPIPIILGFVFLYLAMWIFISRLPGQEGRDWWHETMRHPYFFFCLAGVALFATMKEKNPKKPFRYSFGRVGVWLVITLCLGYFWMGEPSDHPTQIKKAMVAKPLAASVSALSAYCTPREGFLPHNFVNKEKIEKFFGEKGLSTEDVATFVGISERESGYNQFENDGTPYRGRETCEDVGAMQINEFFHLEKEKALGVNFHTSLEGNLEMALLLYRDSIKSSGYDQRFAHWRASEGQGLQIPTLRDKSKETIIVVVKAGVWQMIKLKSEYVMYSSGPLEYITDKKTRGVFRPGDKTRIDTNTMHLKPLEEEDVTITFIKSE